MSEGKRRFVVLHHVSREGEHWDLMLETGDLLATWQIHEDPRGLIRADKPITARRISDHRLAYLDYEGAISGERGHVSRVDAGIYDSVREEPNGWLVRLEGQVLRGLFQLTGSSASQTGVLQRIE